MTGLNRWQERHLAGNMSASLDVLRRFVHQRFPFAGTPFTMMRVVAVNLTRKTVTCRREFDTHHTGFNYPCMTDPAGLSPDDWVLVANAGTSPYVLGKLS